MSILDRFAPTDQVAVVTGAGRGFGAAAVYLASRAAQFVTGKMVEIDGGIQEPSLDLGQPDLA